MLGCHCEHDLANTSQHYYAKHFTLMVAMFPKFFVQCTVYFTMTLRAKLGFRKIKISSTYHLEANHKILLP